jgi:RimJ/RimL family protein N-acetyltransferase
MEVIIKLETKRLILRPITIDDTQDFFEMDSNPNVHLYLGNKPVTSIIQSKAIITDILEQYKTNGLGRLAMIKKDTQEFIGWSGLKYEQNLRKEFNYYDLGYRLKEDFWGKGYATEAALTTLDFGFKHLKLKEICAAADVNNLTSNYILRKIGMKLSGKFTYADALCNWFTIQNPY